MAAAAAIIASQSRRMLVGGLIIKLEPDQFMKEIDSGMTVIHGIHGTIKKSHVYFIVKESITLYCKTNEQLPIKPSLEVEKIDTGGVIPL